MIQEKVINHFRKNNYIDEFQFFLIVFTNQINFLKFLNLINFNHKCLNLNYNLYSIKLFILSNL